MKILLTALLLTFTTAALADDSVIVTQTKSWQSVPITVNEQAHTYTIEKGVALPEGEFYYTYPGYRCLKEKKDIVGVNALIFRAGIPGGNNIYCYSE
ncbi:secreted protein [Legionella steelei]|uniref:Secreted protein n=1 Tax=Legionella steelei TaxID=947033 RepID=A0A0W0ZGV9_9GAMM|nr:hypothetical protein [Legionella steelei]KTD68019.1 secreted protein [Legionella steelei]